MFYGRAMILASLTAFSFASAAALETTRGVDVLRNISPDGRGIELSHAMISAVRKNNEDLTLTRSALATYEYVTDMIGSVDLSDVFSAKVPVYIGHDERLFSLSGTRSQSKFVIDNPRTAMREINISQPFDFATEFRIKKNPNPIPGEKLGYGLRPAFKIDLGSTSHRTLLRFASGLLRMVSPDNLEANKAKGNPKAFIFREFSQTLPETFSLLQRYLDINPTISVSPSGSQTVSRVDGEVTLRVNAIKKDYPELGDYLERLMALEIDLDLNLISETGVNLAQFTANTATRTIGFSYLTRGGKLIPYNDSGSALLAKGFAPDELSALSTSAITNAYANIFGLKFRANGVQVDTHYRDGKVAEANSRLVKLPQPIIEGRLLGVLPDWAIDITIPGSMEGYVQTFTQGLLHANKGEGTVLSTSFDTQDAAHTKLKSEIGTEIVDNFFLGLGLKLVAAYLWPSPEVIHEGRTMVTKHLASLDQDLRKLVEQHKTTTATSGIAH